MNWLRLQYTPGFVEDLTSWEATVSGDGVVVQKVSSSNDMVEHRAQLPPGKIEAVKKRLLAVDFDAAKRALAAVAITDCDEVALSVHDPGGDKNLDGPIYGARELGSKDDALERFIGLWELVASLMPWRGAPDRPDGGE